MARGDITVPQLKQLLRLADAGDAQGLLRAARKIPSLTGYLPTTVAGEFSARQAVNQALMQVEGATLPALLALRESGAGQSRIHQASAGLLDEKAAARPVKAGLLYAKGWQDRPLWLTQGAYPVREWGALVPYVDLDLSRHSAILVVENWEAFERIEHCVLDLSVLGADPIIVYRGDPQLRIGVHKTFCAHARSLHFPGPIAAFMDLDPEGVALADELPGLTHIIHPDLASCDLTRSNARSYALQRHTAKRSVWTPSSPVCLSVWQWMIDHEVAIVQESFFR